ncbi:MAG: DUF4339 domain-containing protein [Proteobacteria bacterium]|nr:DUF4339 domain-containing protein [Pseudomonadota bacterium]
MSDPKWYVAVGDEKQGPYSEEELQGYLDSGEVAPDDLVWRDGMEDWEEAGEIFSEPQSASPEPPPVPKSRAKKTPDNNSTDTPATQKNHGIKPLIFACVAVFLSVIPIVGFVGLALAITSIVLLRRHRSNIVSKIMKSITLVSAILAIGLAIAFQGQFIKHHVKRSMFRQEMLEEDLSSLKPTLGNVTDELNKVRTTGEVLWPNPIPNTVRSLLSDNWTYKNLLVELHGDDGKTAGELLSRFDRDIAEVRDNWNHRSGNVRHYKNYEYKPCKTTSFMIADRFDTVGGDALYEGVLGMEKVVIVFKSFEVSGKNVKMNRLNLCVEAESEQEYTIKMVNKITGAQWDERVFRRTFRVNFPEPKKDAKKELESAERDVLKYEKEMTPQIKKLAEEWPLY